MAKVTVNVANDFLAGLAKASARTAIAELCWNALDADAENVTVTLDTDELGTPIRLSIEDDGTGIPHDRGALAFGAVGASWKRDTARSESQRALHGQNGKGRFRAFSLGRIVRWETHYLEENALKTYSIEGRTDDLTQFEISDPTPSQRDTPGTIVSVMEPEDSTLRLKEESVLSRLTADFALYLSQYPDIDVSIQGSRLDPTSIIAHKASYDVTVTVGGELVPAVVRVVEWTRAVERSLMLCDSDGFSFKQTNAGIHAPGFHFTAYLCANHFRELESNDSLDLVEMDAKSNVLIESARDRLRSHFRTRASENAAAIRDQWRADEIYPFDDEASGAVEKARQDVFDICAYQVHSYLPSFEKGDQTTQRLVFQLLKQALDENPSDVERILVEVLQLPDDKKGELAALLDKTTLSAIISASTMVAHRLEFIEGLENLVFNPQSKNLLKERTQLHKILESNTWIFGEEFHLTVSDQSLTEVLKQHLSVLQREVSTDDFPEVTRADGSRGIIDLMLARSIPQSEPERRDYLVVELKRPSKKVDTGVRGQIESYAQAVVSDPRFTDTKTRWNFLAVSVELDSVVKMSANQRDRAPGLIVDNPDMNLRVWVKPWAQIIREAKGRLTQFQKELQYSVDAETALNHIRQHYGGLIPQELKVRSAEPDDATS